MGDFAGAVGNFAGAALVADFVRRDVSGNDFSARSVGAAAKLDA